MPPLHRSAPLILLLGLVACDNAETRRLGGRSLTPSGCFHQNGEVALHWAPGDRCLPVTYDPALEGYTEVLDAALEAWTAQPCSGLCFEAPQPRRLERGEHPDGQLHLAPSTTRERPQFVQAVLRSKTDTLQLISAVGYVDAEALDPLRPELRLGALTGLIGHMLGLPHTTSGAPSVLTRDLMNLSARPSTEDIELFCKVYGEDGVCAL